MSNTSAIFCVEAGFWVSALSSGDVSISPMQSKTLIQDAIGHKRRSIAALRNPVWKVWKIEGLGTFGGSKF